MLTATGSSRTRTRTRTRTRGPECGPQPTDTILESGPQQTDTILESGPQPTDSILGSGPQQTDTITALCFFPPYRQPTQSLSWHLLSCATPKSCPSTRSSKSKCLLPAPAPAPPPTSPFFPEHPAALHPPPPLSLPLPAKRRQMDSAAQRLQVQLHILLLICHTVT